MTTLAKAHAAVDFRHGDILGSIGCCTIGACALHIDDQNNYEWWLFRGPERDDWVCADPQDEPENPVLIYVNETVDDAIYERAAHLARKYGVRLVVLS